MEFSPFYEKKKIENLNLKKEKIKRDEKIWYPPATLKEYRRVRYFMLQRTYGGFLISFTSDFLDVF